MVKAQRTSSCRRKTPIWKNSVKAFNRRTYDAGRLNGVHSIGVQLYRAKDEQIFWALCPVE
jgi:hypothetical protein